MVVSERLSSPFGAGNWGPLTRTFGPTVTPDVATASEREEEAVLGRKTASYDEPFRNAAWLNGRLLKLLL
jgi:hypothetical protein